jgi:mRNA interferase YafQ
MKQDIKRLKRRGKNLQLLEEVINTLSEQKPLDEKHLDHQLSGPWHDFRECHIENDWLLIYRIDEAALILSATRTGTHADFGW